MQMITTTAGSTSGSNGDVIMRTIALAAGYSTPSWRFLKSWQFFYQSLNGANSASRSAIKEVKK